MRIPTIVLVAVTLAACQSATSRPLTGTTVSEAKTREAAAVFFVPGGCPVSGPAKPASDEEMAILGALVGAAAPLIADFAVRLTSAFIQAQKEGLNGTFPATGATTGIYTAEGKLSFQCLVIVRGMFGETKTERPEGGDETMKKEDLGELPNPLADYPPFYLEAAASLTNGALLLEPKYIRYGDSSARRRGSGRKHVGMVLALLEKSAKTGEAPSDDESAALYRFNLGRLEIGKSYAGALLAGTSALQVLPKFETAKLVPANALAIVTESEEPGMLLSVLSESFDAKKDDLSAALAKIIQDAVKPKEGQQ